MPHRTVARRHRRLWSLLIVRDALLGARRFSQFQKNLGVAKNILTVRLRTLVAEGILEMKPVSDGGAYQDYLPTAKARGLFPVLVALRQWGEEFVIQPGESFTALVDRKDGLPLSKLQIRRRMAACSIRLTRESRFRQLARKHRPNFPPPPARAERLRWPQAAPCRADNRAYRACAAGRAAPVPLPPRNEAGGLGRTAVGGPVVGLQESLRPSRAAIRANPSKAGNQSKGHIFRRYTHKVHNHKYP